MVIARFRPAGGSLPANGRRENERHSNHRVLGTQSLALRVPLAAIRTPVRLRPRPSGTPGPTSVQHGRKLTDASDKDAGRRARPTRAIGCRLPLRVDRVVVGVVICKRQMGSKRESSAPLGRSILTHPKALSANRRQCLVKTGPSLSLPGIPRLRPGHRRARRVRSRW